MKISKIVAILFVATFFIGIVSYVLFYRINNLLLLNEVKIVENTAQIKLETQPKIEKKESSPTEVEILQENNDWETRGDSKYKIKLLEIGEGFHGDEVKAKSGETWLSLFEENGVCYLETTKLEIRRVHDPVVDDNETQKTGKSVSLKNKANSIFLLKNADTLKQGKINTLYRYDEDSENTSGEESSISNRYIKEFRIGETVYTLKAKKGKNKVNEDILALVLEGNGISQTIHSIKTFEESDYLGGLYWAGDLDQDGKPDFYFDLHFQDNVEYKNLFLSSQAKKGKLVEKVASFTTTGC